MNPNPYAAPFVNDADVYAEEHRKIHGHDFDPMHEGERYPPCRHEHCLAQGEQWHRRLTEARERPSALAA